MRTLRRVAVLGAGTMGSRIAAHFANARVPALLLDVVIPGQQDRSFASRKGLENAAKQKPAAFYTDSAIQLVTPGNFEDHLHQISECDWILEAVTEDLEVKRSLWQRVAQHRRPDAIVSTNTSGIPLSAISEGFPEAFRRHFLGTHFFNPPRYLHLLEMIPGAETDPSVLEFVASFCDVRLGKGVVPCKDTPNFIANRIGSFYGSTVLKIAVEDGYTVEEVDAIVGPLIGAPKTAQFRLLDLVGLDVWAFVSKNLYGLVPDDPWRERFLPPPFLSQMLERGWLGDKAGQGFYKKIGPEKAIQALDWKTLEYHPSNKVSFPSIEFARQVEDLPHRLRVLVEGKDRVGAFLWKLFSDLFIYSAEMTPEISDRIVEIDRAMRWGYAQTFGPFELWDALGFDETVSRIESEGRTLPRTIYEMRRAGASSFYGYTNHEGPQRIQYFKLIGSQYEILEPRPGVLSLNVWKQSAGEIRRNAGASLVDLGDGCLCVEFHSKMNALGDDAIEMIYCGLDETERNFQALILANEGENFSVGANLMLVLLASQDEEWEDLDAAVHRFQQCSMALKYAARPVVAAPFNRALGGGCELVMHCARSQAAAELYMGLVETGVGLIPAGGGCKELLIRLRDPRKIFELIGMAKVSTSAHDARSLGLLHKSDPISMNRERQIYDAKQLALSLAGGYSPGSPQNDIPVSGGAGYAAMKLGAWMMRQGDYISEHDMVIAEKLAGVLSGGRVAAGSMVSEQHLLDLEREAFLSLCGMRKTQERMEHMLKTGKPLRS